MSEGLAGVSDEKTGTNKARVREFVRQWEAQMRKPNGGKTDLIYSVFFDMDAGEVELLCSDLRGLVDEMDRLQGEIARRDRHDDRRTL